MRHADRQFHLVFAAWPSTVQRDWGILIPSTADGHLSRLCGFSVLSGIPAVFANDHGHWTAAGTLGGPVGPQSLHTLDAWSTVTQFCREMVPAYPPPAVPESFSPSHFAPPSILPGFTDARPQSG